VPGFVSSVLPTSRPLRATPAAVPDEVCPGESPSSGLPLSLVNEEFGPNDAASVVGPTAAWLPKLEFSLRIVAPLALPAFDVPEVFVEVVVYVVVVVDRVAGAGVPVTTGAGDAAADAAGTPVVDTAVAAYAEDAASAHSMEVRHCNGDGLRMASFLSDR
jgi:hypothetical protein